MGKYLCCLCVQLVQAGGGSNVGVALESVEPPLPASSGHWVSPTAERPEDARQAESKRGEVYGNEAQGRAEKVRAL